MAAATLSRDRDQPVVTGPRLWLASRSPRRREMLAAAGIAHAFDHPGLEDSELEPGAVTPAQWVMSLAYLKAAAGLASLRKAGQAAGRVVLGADTTCIVGNQMLGTPADADDARRILRALENAAHDVVTGVSLIDADTGQRVLFADAANVRVGILGPRLDEYIAGGQWQGKAGAYNLSERLSAGWPIHYTGDPSTIMGLPMRALLPRLAAFGLGPTVEAA
jgi:septum formation protein